jgi:transaldolase
MSTELKQFYVDTADVEYIGYVLEFLHKRGLLHHFRGITTNPNAMAKVNAHSLPEWESAIRKVVNVVDYWGLESEVHVQLPNTQVITADEVRKYVDRIRCVVDGNSAGVQLGIKISPLQLYRQVVGELQSECVVVNVTGLADHASVLRASSFGVDYASIIPGRMEEVNINANAHLEFLQTSNLDETKVITGSMRTIQGLLDAFIRDTLPTIGTRVWDQILTSDDLLLEKCLHEPTLQPVQLLVPPIIDYRNITLSKEFFASMDELGTRAYIGLRG